MSTGNLHLEVKRDDLTEIRWREEPLAALAPGQVRLRIERFAVTANTVTYAVTGDLLGYWSFYPGDGPWGRVPAMGWAQVVESAHPEVATGGRYFGWYPMSRHIDVRVAPIDLGLRDEGEHRAGHAAVYRTFSATDRDPYYTAGDDSEDRSALLRGLFLTGYLADDFFAELEYCGARRVVVLSASSKTAIGFAQCAARRDVEVLGVTSARNADFVRGLGYYDRVLPYANIEALPTDADVVSIDMAGDGPVLERVHAHFGDRLRHSMVIGMSHHDAPRAEVTRGPAPEFFFAPTQVAKRSAEWGPAEFQARAAGALRDFVDASRGWLQVARGYGSEAAERTWNEVRGGAVPANEGRVVSLWPRD